MKPVSLVKTAHDIVRRYVQTGAIAIDATVGNGHDTSFLAEQVGVNGRVYGFDIQAQALTSARARLQQRQLETRAILIHDNHARLANLIPMGLHGRISAVMFNLGYLPGGDNRIITRAESTLKALESALMLLAPKGIMTVVAYPGHQGGGEETAAVENWCQRTVHHRINIGKIESTAPNGATPRLWHIEKSD